MDTAPKYSAPNAAAKRPPSLTVLRWMLVAAWIAVVFLVGPSLPIPMPAVSVIGFAGLSFVLVNALWQHMSLKASCVVAAILAGVIGVVGEAVVYLATGQEIVAFSWLTNAIGAILGALIAYPVIQKVDALMHRALK